MTNTEAIRDIFAGEAERRGLNGADVFEAWLADLTRQAMSAGWEEGFGDGYNAAERGIAPSRPRNPYAGGVVDPEEFCDQCFAGVTSPEHYGKCEAAESDPYPSDDDDYDDDHDFINDDLHYAAKEGNR